MKAILIAVIALGETAFLPLHAELIGTNGLAGVKSVGDAICTVSDSVAMSNDIAIVDYVLKPEAESHIRCRIALPPRE